MSKEYFESGKNTAIIAYLTIIGSIIAVFMNQEEKKMNLLPSIFVKH